MKKNIVVCCEKMLTGLVKGDVFHDGQINIVGSKGPQFSFCPWCRAKLPFTYDPDPAQERKE